MGKSTSTKALLAGVSGTALQWYDFAIFGYFSSIIASTYFPKDNHFISLLSTFGVFAVGYLLAPLGSFLFGYYLVWHYQNISLSGLNKLYEKHGAKIICEGSLYSHPTDVLSIKL